MPIKFISLFSGVGTASYALNPYGFECIACSEIDPFASAVIKYHYPNLKNEGDITKADWSKYRGKADLIIGGSPCQTFSIAGNRTGLKGLSGLLIDYVETLRTVRPRFFILENVPGILTCHGGKDFGLFLREVGNIGYRLAWRVLDSEFYGVSQQRRRVYVVGEIGADGGRKILFDSPRMPSHYPSITEKRKQYFNGIEANTVQTSSDRIVTRVNYHKLRIRKAWEPVNTLTAQAGNDTILLPMVIHNDRLRRFTPVECERLQGLPDGWTDIPFKGESHPTDSRRYKALGNGFCAPVISWIGKRLADYIQQSSKEKHNVRES